MVYRHIINNKELLVNIKLFNLNKYRNVFDNDLQVKLLYRKIILNFKYNNIYILVKN